MIPGTMLGRVTDYVHDAENALDTGVHTAPSSRAGLSGEADPSPGQPACDGCPAAMARYEATGDAVVCVCGRVYAADDFRWPATAALADDDTATAPRAPHVGLGHLLADLDVVAAWERERSAPIAPRAQPSPLARMQSLAACGAASGPSSTRQVAQLEAMILSPSSRFGRTAREAFVASLLRYCEETSRPDRDPVDPVLAARLAHRYARLAHTDYGPALAALRRHASPRTTWDVACAIVADACATDAARASWAARPTGRPGRPRIDPTRPPPDVARLAWGAAHLAAAIDAWEVANA